MSGHNDKLHFVEKIHSFFLSKDLCLKFMQKFIRRIILYSEKRVSDINKEDSSDFLYDIGVE